MKKTNVERLEEEKLIESASLSDDDKDIINALSDNEVREIINAGKKIKSNAKGGAPVLKIAL